MPYDKDTFIVHLMAGVEDHAMRQAIVQFGVKERGFASRFSSAIKSAESLAFMRLNPAYAVRNMVNNEVTMVARGVFGLMGADEIKGFWKSVGFVPKRLEESMNLGADLEKVTSKAGQTLNEALQPKVEGLPEKFKSAINNFQIGKDNKFDVTKFSQGLEKSASERAMTNGYMSFFHDHWQAPKMEKLLDGDTLHALNQADPELAGVINQAIKSSYGSEEKLAQALGNNLHLSTQAVLDEAGTRLGMKVEEQLGTELTAHRSEERRVGKECRL